MQSVVAVVTALVVALLSCDADAQPRVLSPFGATTGPEGYPRREGSHQGVDLAAAVGTPVIAPAEGVVNRIIADDLCGTGMVLSHGPLATVYCHLSEVSVQIGQSVRRGDVLGRTGVTGRGPDPGFEHLHFELRDGPAREATRLDPMPFVAGCFDGLKRYPTDRLALTYPLPCSPRR
jgi:murein DD-endopeptidase MepM/ murein hydrolase activator NlpD